MIKRLTYILALVAIPFMVMAKKGNTVKSSNIIEARDSSSFYFTAEFDSILISAVCEYEAGNDSLFYSLISRASQMNPYSSVAKFELGKYNITKLRHYIEGESYIKEAIKLAPDNYFYADYLGDYYTNSKMYDSAISLYNEMSRNFPKKLSSLYKLRDVYYSLQEYDNILKINATLEKREGFSLYLGLYNANILAYLNRTKAALKELDRTIKSYPLSDVAYVYKGDIYAEDIRMYNSAIEMYNKSLEIAPENEAALFSLVRLYSQYDKVELLEETLLRIFASKDVSYKKKSNILQESIKLFSRHTDYLQRLEKAYKLIIESHEDVGEAHAIYADFLLQLNRKEEAIEELRTSVYVSPKCISCWESLLATVSVDSTKEDVISGVLQDALDAIPEYPVFYYYAGIVSYSYNDLPAAKDYFHQALVKLKPANKVLEFQIYKTLGSLYYELNDKDSSFMYLDSALSIMNTSNPDLELLNNYAYFLAVAREKLDKAEEYSFSTITKSPLNPIYLDTYAYIKFCKGEYEIAKFYIERAFEYSSSLLYNDSFDLSELYDHYGDILYMNGNVDEAIEKWNKAIELGIKNKELINRKVQERKYYEK